MKKLSILFIAFLSIQFTSFAQTPDTLWTRTFVGEGAAVLQTQNGNFLIGGSSPQYPSLITHPYLICVDENGNEIWSKSWVNDSSISHPVYSILPEIYELNMDSYVMGSGYDAGIIWYNRSTDSTSERFYASSGWDFTVLPITVKKIQDDGYMVAWNMGSWIGHGNLLKVNLLGDTLWYKNYGEGGWEGLVWFYDVEPTNDGGYIILGSSLNTPFLLMKTNEFGDSLWTKSYNDTSKNFNIKCLLQTQDNGYLILTDVYESTYPWIFEGICLYRTDENGDTLWTRNLGFFGEEVLDVMKPTPDGGFILVGSTADGGVDYSDILIVKVDSLGYKQWSKTIGSSNGDYASDICVTSDGGYIIVGTMSSYGVASRYIWVIRLGSDPVGIKEDLSSLVPDAYSLSQNFPNPFNPSTKINYSVPQSSQVIIKVFDILGNEIETLVNEEKITGTYELTWNAADLPSGVYFYQLRAGIFIETKKMILLK